MSFTLRLPQWGGRTITVNRGKYLRLFPTSVLASALQDKDLDVDTIDIPDISVTPSSLDYLATIVNLGDEDQIPDPTFDLEQLMGAYRYLGLELFGLLMSPNLDEIKKKIHLFGEFDIPIDSEYVAKEYTTWLKIGLSYPEFLRYIFAIIPPTQTAEQKFLEQKFKKMTPEVLAMFLRRPDVDPSFDRNFLLSYFTESKTKSRPHLEVLLKSDKVDPSLGNNKILFELYYGILGVRNSDILELLLQHPKIDPMARSGRLLAQVGRNGDVKSVTVLLNDARVDPSVNSNEAYQEVCSLYHGEIRELLLSHPRFDPNNFTYTGIMDLGAGALNLLLTHHGVNATTRSYIEVKLAQDRLRERTTGFPIDYSSLYPTMMAGMEGQEDAVILNRRSVSRVR